ncbi:MAG: T9SS type A sorting domain-containing protein, partial [bacterium]
MKRSTIIFFVFGLITNPLLAQGHGHGGNQHGMWPDSLETITLTGTTIVDSTHFMPMYYLDVNNDHNADYHLSFGPYWYEPASGATRPNDGDNITVVGTKWGHEFDVPNIVVYEINGLKWREPIEGDMHGWDGDHFWGDAHDDTTLTGTILIDSSYFYVHYFLDTDSDQRPDFMLNFGPPWFLQANEALLPKTGDVITVTGGLHEEEMMMIPSLMVYEINGIKWRNTVGPPPWSGNWIHRNAMDTTFVHAPTDSMDWMSHPPGSMMGNMMGGGMFPDSVYCQFEEMYPDHLPGQHDSTLFAGYYMNMYNPKGQTMMGMGGMMGGMGRMRFNRPTTFQFHYDEDHMHQMGLSDAQLIVKYWNDNNSTWMHVNNYTIDDENNIITFQNDEMYSYYALFGSVILTGIEEEGNKSELPTKFILYQNYPNPFNPETTIRFELSAQGNVNLTIYDLLGRKVRTLLDREIGAGLHQLKWNGKDDSGQSLSSGV